jgi:hypothetical protein
MESTNEDKDPLPAQRDLGLHAETGKVAVTPSASVNLGVKRGKESWAYIYTLLGFALTIETGVVALISPLKWPWNLVTFAIAAVITGYLFLDNGWFQNKLIGLKGRQEEKLR